VQTQDASTPGLPVENISVSGIFVRSATVFAVGTSVSLQLVRPGLAGAVPMHGCVVSVVSLAEARAQGTTAGMGIRTQPADAEGARRLGELVATLAVMERPGAEPVTTVAQLLDADDDASACHEADDDALRNRIIESLGEEVRSLRRALSRRGSIIRDMANHIRTLEMAAASASAPVSVRTPAVRRPDARAG
jgi:hypothetical protein